MRAGFPATLLVTLCAAACAAGPPAAPWSVGPFALDEVSIAELQHWMAEGRYTSRQLVQLYLDRIAAIDAAGPTLRSVLEVNPEALDIAGALDRERAAQGPRGPLHGVPVLVKDNIDTGDRMATTAGSLALGAASRDAVVVGRLRAAGAVIIGKTNLSEWANFRSAASTSGWSARGGLVRHPYVLDHNPCGSSSGTGVAVAASLAAVGVGTETDGSIVCPSAVNGIVGIKPTVGLVSRTGVVPISHTQDTPGPMARTVADAAALLSVMTGVDPQDPATGRRPPAIETDYVGALDRRALAGARLGVVRGPLAGYSPAADRLLDAAIADLRAQGAAVVDPADMPTAGQLGECEIEILLYEFKAGLNGYLASRTPRPLVQSLADLIAFNERERAREMPYFGQDLFLRAQEKGPLTTPAYLDALATCRRLARDEGIDAVLSRDRLDALMMLTTGPAWVTDLAKGDAFAGSGSRPAAVAGYPSITVPAGFAGELPVGMLFVGGAWSEARLIGLAYAYEQTTRHRRPPRFLRSAPRE
jgi:amidase